MLESSKGMYRFHFFFWWLSKCKISSALKFLTVSQFILYLSSYFCFNSSMPESFGVSWVVVCWHLNLILLACNLTFFWKKWIRSIPHIWSQIPLFRVTLTYVNYQRFFDFFTCFFVWMQNLLTIVIVMRCHTGLTFYFLRFCFIFAKDVKYFEKWKWKVSKYLSSFC